MKAWTRLALCASGAVPLLVAVIQGDTTLLVYPVFLVVYLAVPRFRRPGQHQSPGWPVVVISVIASGWTAEVMAWTSNYVADASRPALLSPQLLSDLFLAVGFYGGWAVAWILVLRRYRFSLTEVFAVTGVMGVFVEQNGSVAASILGGLRADPLTSVILAVYVFTVYGSIMGTASLLARFDTRSSVQSGGWLKYPAVVVLMFVASAAFTAFASYFGGMVGLVHQPLPIRAHPLF